ncbi:MAG: hypothetical protein ABSG90_14840, partial [Dehalococcoidia bacterium]
KIILGGIVAILVVIFQYSLTKKERFIDHKIAASKIFTDMKLKQCETLNSLMGEYISIIQKTTYLGTLDNDSIPLIKDKFQKVNLALFILGQLDNQISVKGMIFATKLAKINLMLLSRRNSRDEIVKMAEEVNENYLELLLSAIIMVHFCRNSVNNYA